MAVDIDDGILQIAKVQLTHNQSVIERDTDVRIDYDSVLYDPSGIWDDATKQFIPKIAGYYSIYASAHLFWTDDKFGASDAYIRIRLNDLTSSSGVMLMNTSGGTIITVNDVLFLNGITDYINFSVIILADLPNRYIAASSGTYATIMLVKAA